MNDNFNDIKNPVFSDAGGNVLYHKSKKKVKTTLIPRQVIDTNVWKSFKSLIPFADVTQAEGITNALILWIKKYSNLKYSCNRCKSIIETGNYVVVIKNNIEVHYCSFKCMTLSEKENEQSSV